MSKVMIVDDSKDIGVFCELVANIVGVEAIYAENVQEALNLLDNGVRPNVILLDLYMPGRQPEELLEKVKASADLSETRVVLMSSVNDVKDFAATMGADASIKKPFNVEQLSGSIQQKVS